MAAVPTKATLLLFIFFSMFLCSYQKRIRSVGVKIAPTVGQPWPAPKQMVSSSQVYFINAEKFEFLDPKRCEVLQEAFVRYQRIIFGSQPAILKPWEILRANRTKTDVLTSLTVNVQQACRTGAFPSFESDESYTLSVSSQGASISANEVWGALRGLETFSQLIQEDETGQFLINDTQITDSPRFKHRGILLDSSLHFISLRVLKENLNLGDKCCRYNEVPLYISREQVRVMNTQDLMAQNKFNVFHWHIVDDPAFPYESVKFPNMSLLGAYNPLTHVYTQADIHEIIEYARLRGIRVIPEFDSPGHALSWGQAITDLLTKCYKGGSWDGNYGPIDPEPSSTYSFLTEFFTEIATVFPDHFVHLGGDEVDFYCWESNPDVKAFMKKMGFGTDYVKLEEYYMTKLLKIVGGLKRRYIVWQEIIDNGVKLAEDTVVEVWKGDYKDELSKVTSLGYQTLLSSCWYLDLIAYGTQWKNYYSCEPYDFSGTEAQKKLVIGGEACLWTEFVDDTNLLSRLWPRASAVAERLWSPMSVNDTATAAPRLEEHRCRLVRRGFPAEPVNGPGFCKSEYP